jgi:peptide/nickel transport system substrate-binding protein
MTQERRRHALVAQAAVFLTPLLFASIALAQSPLRILMDAPPQTLNPRMTQDAPGQRIAALLFPALTRQDSRLRVHGDLAEDIRSDPTSHIWRFRIRRGLQDHQGAAITPAELLECFTHYRDQKPLALVTQALAPWKSLRVEGPTLVFELEKSDPYFSRNVTLLRYFRQEGLKPCENPVASKPLIGAGDFRADILGGRAPDQELTIERREAGGSFRARARLIFVRDENTRVIRMMRGDADLAQNAFSPVRFRWLASRHPEKFRLIEAPGVNVSYLSFNVRHPVLKDPRVRRALALAVPVRELVQGKFANMVDPAASFLSPLLEDSAAPAIARENPAEAERLLDEAGYPRRNGAPRFQLVFKTTPLREGHEPARVLQESFRKLGIDVRLEVVEPAVFMAAIRNASYEIALGRWVGVADPSILERSLRSAAATNRAGYADAKMDQLLDRHDWKQVQLKMADDLPYFPLWFWKNAVLLRKGLTGLEPSQISLSGALHPLMEVSKE